ncbi:MAG: glycosyl transferase, partial [Acidimicrobiia bacterium]|nr:glycosyl transferase [Acidimicrobiia bacterium]
LARWVHDVSGVTAQIAPMPLDPVAIAETTPPPPHGQLLAVGRLVHEKGFDVLIEAVAETQLPLILVGDGPLRAELEDLAARRHAPVRFVGAVPPSALAHLYIEARAVVVPSRREGFGLVAAEALASARTVIASRVGGLVDIVTPGVNGTLVPPDDPATLAEALRQLDPALGQAGPATVAYLSAANVAQRELRLYASILAEHPHGAD